jgi:heme exporter protein C
MYPAFLWNIVAWAMWGVFILVLRFTLERRRQRAEQEATLRSLESSIQYDQHFNSHSAKQSEPGNAF